MAVYFDHKVEKPIPGPSVDIEWHSSYPLLAVASRSDGGGGCVHVYRDEGELLEHATMQRACPSMSLDWHPVRPIVAAGWENGEILIWNEQERELYWAEHLHKSEVVLLKWSPNGTRLVSGDKNGLMIAWKADHRGRLQPGPFCKHELPQMITQCVFRPSINPDAAADTAALARAAVSGDESALDMFSWKKGNNKASIKINANDAQTCFISGSEGNVFYLDEKGACKAVFNADGAVKKLLYNEYKDILVVVTETLMLSQFSVSSDGHCQEIMKVKLSGKLGDFQVIWAGRGLLAVATGETLIRMWDLERDDNYVLSLDGHQGFETGECINCLSYSSAKGVLAGGTNNGKIALWKYAPASGAAGRKQEGETKWKLQSPGLSEGNILQIKWGSSKNYLAVNNIASVIIFTEQVMSSHLKDEVACVQVSPSVLSIDMYSSGIHHDLKTDIHIKGVYASKEHVAIWNGRKVVTYEIGPSIRAVGTFTTESTIVAVYDQNVYTTEPGKIQVRTFQGTVKQLISFSEIEGEPISLDINGYFMVVGTSTGYIKVFDLSRREAKLHTNPKCLLESLPKFGTIVSAKINCNGTKVSVLSTAPSGVPEPTMYVWDVDMDTTTNFDFAVGHGEQEDFSQSDEKEEDQTDVERGRSEAARDIAGRYPVSHYWDPQEPKLMVCEAKLLPTTEQTTPKKSLMSSVYVQPEVVIVSLFSTLEHGVMLQDSFAVSENHNAFMGLEVPYFYFVKKLGEIGPDDPHSPLSNLGNAVARQVMRDFVGLEDGDKSARDAMMNFSYYLTIGNMDEAFKAIKLIKSESVWENMAKMCVKTRRLDVAKVCLGNMGHARGAKSLREAEKEPELDARVAMLAVQLGLLDDAERLLKTCKRYDLLNDFYQSSGQWSKAMECAELHDRIHLRTTYYNYAKHLEAKGDINGAIPNYEKSDTHRFEVPRMLFDEPQALEAYIMKTKDKALRKWWAQFMESTGEMETALQFYEAAQDYLSLCRVYCYCGNMDKAAEICNETGDRAACYHLARQYENQDNVKDAIHFFTRAQAYSQAIRLCKENGMEDQLMNLALMSTKEDMIEAARYYENNPHTQDKAVMLYHKGGHFSKALDLAFRTEQFGALQLIADDLDERTDPTLLNKCADFFMEHGQYDKAVELLIVAKRYLEALDLCVQHNVTITEKLAEKMTIPKDSDKVNSETRIKLLEKVADCAFTQGSYHLATKKYTQAGNKVKAMRALLKSGDTEKIVFFAGVSRQKEIYVMAANYLQSLDWRKDPEIMKSIIGFYTKGRALDSLAGFYDACAQVEIDEYQNYDKALGALSEAYKCLTKAKMKNVSQQEERIASLKHRIGLVKKFVQARRFYDEDPEESMKQCQLLLEETDLDSAVRIGDVYGLMIEHYARTENYKQAYHCMEEMRKRVPAMNMAYYVNMRTVEAIHKALDIPLGRGMAGDMKDRISDEEDGDVVEEEIYNGDDYC
ncbi:intraflagellar transport protein 140 homolog isoform X2 [Ptychodera flava]